VRLLPIPIREHAMPCRQIALLIIAAVGLSALVMSGIFSPYWSIGDVLAMAAFSVVFLFIMFLTLLSRGKEPVDGHRGLPRSFWVLFASFASAFAFAMFGAVLVLPWVGFRGFDFLLGAECSWFVLPVLAAIAYPFVKRKLL